MTDPISFTATTPRFRLPLLFVGQAQKEFTVNEAHVLADVLLHASCQGTAATPPVAPVEGDAWIVGEEADGDWAGHDGQLAAWQAGTWLFVTPRDGMRVFDLSSGRFALYRGGWQLPEAPAAPSGGSTVDTQARDAISALVAALVDAGIFAQD